MAAKLQFSLLQNKKFTKFFDSVVKFVTKLHSFPNFPRSDVSKIKCLVEDLILTPALDLINQKLQDRNDVEPVLRMTKELRSTYQQCKSDFKFNKNLMEKELIGNIESFKILNNFNSNGIIMPLEFQLTKIFEENDYLQEMLKYMREIEKKCKVGKFYSRFSLEAKMKLMYIQTKLLSHIFFFLMILV